MRDSSAIYLFYLYHPVSSNCEIVEKFSIERILLIKLSWEKSREEVTWGGHVVKDKWEERYMVDNSSSQT